MFMENVSTAKINSEPLMPSSVIAWTTAAIFYFVHNIFFVVGSRAVSVWRHFDRRWSCAQVNASTPTTTTICPDGAHTVVSVEHRTANGEVESVQLCACCEPSTCIRLRSLTHTHTRTRPVGVAFVCSLGWNYFVLLYGWRGSLPANREKIIRYGIGCRGSVTASIRLYASNSARTEAKRFACRRRRHCRPTNEWSANFAFAKMFRPISPVTNDGNMSHAIASKPYISTYPWWHFSDEPSKFRWTKNANANSQSTRIPTRRF